LEVVVQKEEERLMEKWSATVSPAGGLVVPMLILWGQQHDLTDMNVAGGAPKPPAVGQGTSAEGKDPVRKILKVSHRPNVLPGGLVGENQEHMMKYQSSHEQHEDERRQEG